MMCILGGSFLVYKKLWRILSDSVHCKDNFKCYGNFDRECLIVSVMMVDVIQFGREGCLFMIPS